jgi:two-component system, NtrC family, response regulator HydG
VCEDGAIRSSDLSLRPVSPSMVNDTNLDSVERSTIERLMREAEGNKAKASRKLGISRTKLYMRLRKHGLDHMSLVRGKVI